jgi:hypothetical protein
MREHEAKMKKLNDQRMLSQGLDKVIRDRSTDRTMNRGVIDDMAENGGISKVRVMGKVFKSKK